MTPMLRLPRITGDEREQLARIKSYLSELVSQLQTVLEERSVSNAVESRSILTPAAKSEADFGQIKSLIIRSAEIVESYCEQIKKRLEGVYLARSEFGTFAENTAHEITASATALESLFRNIGVLSSEMNSVQDKLLEANAYLRSGLLGYTDEGHPLYGLEIGQRTLEDGREVFDKYARFTADRLSFYDGNGTEVAYISDYKLCITSAQVDGTLTLGRYVADTADGLAWRWQ